MSEPWIGQIIQFGGNFAILDYAFCDGQLMSISTNDALFALIGTTYGGDGATTFALPDLRGRVPLHQGTGPGLTSRVLGESLGEETVTLLPTQLPMHMHAILAGGIAGASSPSGTLPGNDTQVPVYATQPAATLSPAIVNASGGSQPHDNMAPSLGINFQIALWGIFPSQN